MLSQVTRHFAGLWLAALAVGAWGAQAPLSVAEIATGVFVHRGAVAEVTRDNGGDIANLSFVVGERCVERATKAKEQCAARCAREPGSGPKPRP